MTGSNGFLRRVVCSVVAGAFAASPFCGITLASAEGYPSRIVPLEASAMPFEYITERAEFAIKFADGSHFQINGTGNTYSAQYYGIDASLFTQNNDVAILVEGPTPSDDGTDASKTVAVTTPIKIKLDACTLKNDDGGSNPPVRVLGTSAVEFVLSGVNAVQGDLAGIEVESGASATFSGDGSLNVKGGQGPAIGGRCGVGSGASGTDGGAITISGGTITAESSGSPAIGGGVGVSGASGRDISVTSSSTPGGSGGNGGSLAAFTINGGKLTATSTSGAGIGGAAGASGGNGGNAGVASCSRHSAPGGNGGNGGNGGQITLAGGVLSATGTTCAIGGGNGGAGGNGGHGVAAGAGGEAGGHGGNGGNAGTVAISDTVITTLNGKANDKTAIKAGAGGAGGSGGDNKGAWYYKNSVNGDPGTDGQAAAISDYVEPSDNDVDYTYAGENYESDDSDDSEPESTAKIADYALISFITGIDSTHFSPDGTITWGQMVTILYRIFGQKAPVSTNVGTLNQAGITYTAKDNYYLPYATWALQQGVCGDQTASQHINTRNISLSNSVTREEMAFLLEFFDNKYGNVFSKNLTTTVVPNFTDKSKISYSAAVNALAACGVINGIEATDTTVSFNPKGTVTRAQAVKMVVIFLGRGSRGYDKTKSAFADVSSTHWAFDYVMNAAYPA